MLDAKAFLRLRDLLIEEKSRLLEYKNLFVDSDTENRKILLNKTAPGFFNMVFHLLWEDMVLSVSKLTDYAKTKRKGQDLKNLTVKLLVESWESKDVVTFGQMTAVLQELESVVAMVRMYRSKVVTHQDYDQALSGTLVICLSNIEKAFELVGQILNLHSTKIGLGYFCFDSAPIGGVSSLIRCLEDSQIYRQTKSERGSELDGNMES